MCRSSRWDTRDSWAIERRPSERRPSADVRASDADRQATIDQLSRHTGDGRLTLDEFESRVDEAWQAATHRDLQHVLRELPAERPTSPRRHPEAQLRRAAALVLIIIGAALLIGPSSLWWLIPLAWFKLGAVGHHDRRRQYREIDKPRDDELVRA